MMPVTNHAFLLPICVGLLVAATAVSSEAKLDSHTEAALQAAINGDHRSAVNKARDKYRKPLETLAYFGFRSNMTVVEAWPGAGWYTEILAPALREKGKLYAAHYSVNPSYGYNGLQRRYLGTFLSKMGAYPDAFDKVQVTTLYYPYEVKTAPNGVADLALTFRNAHNWVVPGYGGENAVNTHFRSLFDALKPGATLGVVDHRWPDPATEDPASGNGYISEERLIALVTAAGFELVTRSDMHRNPKDTHEHPNGVWSLPPDLAVADENRVKYIAIGESDRMTLKFRKPIN